MPDTSGRGAGKWALLDGTENKLEVTVFFPNRDAALIWQHEQNQLLHNDGLSALTGFLHLFPITLGLGLLS